MRWSFEEIPTNKKAGLLRARLSESRSLLAAFAVGQVLKGACAVIDHAATVQGVERVQNIELLDAKIAVGILFQNDVAIHGVTGEFETKIAQCAPVHVD